MAVRGWGDVTWTRDPLVPNQVRYQTALHLNKKAYPIIKIIHKVSSNFLPIR